MKISKITGTQTDYSMALAHGSAVNQAIPYYTCKQTVLVLSIKKIIRVHVLGVKFHVHYTYIYISLSKIFID